MDSNDSVKLQFFIFFYFSKIMITESVSMVGQLMGNDNKTVRSKINCSLTLNHADSSL